MAYRPLHAVPDQEPQPVLDTTMPCTNKYDCPCVACFLDRKRAISRGVRPIQPVPLKKAA